DVDAAVLRPVACRHGGHGNLPAAPRRDQVAVGREQPQQACADGAKPGDANPQGVGHALRCLASRLRGWAMMLCRSFSALARNRLRLRAAWRMRCSFSTSAILT